MNVETFIRKHITAELVAEGFPESVAGGGQQTTALSIIAACHRQVKKAGRLPIVFSTLANGRLGKLWRQRGKWAKKKPERVAPLTGYFDLGVSS